MAVQIPNEVARLSGTQRQLGPEELQNVDGELQTVTQSPMPLIEIAEPEKREPPGPVSPYGPEAHGAISPVARAAATVAFPILRLTRYSAGDTSFVTLLSWEIPGGFVGDLREISLKSDNDNNTRYRISIGGADMQIPTDRPTSTPLTMKWGSNMVPGPSSILIEVLSVDGSVITVDAMITGVLKIPTS